jgi:hypothetical protein
MDAAGSQSTAELAIALQTVLDFFANCLDFFGLKTVDNFQIDKKNGSGNTNPLTSGPFLSA